MKYKGKIKISIEFRPWSSNICVSGTPKIKKTIMIIIKENSQEYSCPKLYFESI